MQMMIKMIIIRVMMITMIKIKEDHWSSPKTQSLLVILGEWHVAFYMWPQLLYVASIVKCRLN